MQAEHANSACPPAKECASGPRARFKFRPAYTGLIQYYTSNVMSWGMEMIYFYNYPRLFAFSSEDMGGHEGRQMCVAFVELSGQWTYEITR